MLVVRQYTQKIFMPITLSTTSKNAALLIYDGYSYVIDRRTDKKILWKCGYCRKYKCYGRLHTDPNNILKSLVNMKITLVIHVLD